MHVQLITSGVIPSKSALAAREEHAGRGFAGVLKKKLRAKPSVTPVVEQSDRPASRSLLGIREKGQRAHQNSSQRIKGFSGSRRRPKAALARERT